MKTNFCDLENMSQRIIRNHQTYKNAKELERKHKLDEMIFNNYFHRACASLVDNPKINPNASEFISSKAMHTGMKLAVTNLNLQNLFKPLYEAQFVTEKREPTLEFPYEDVWCGYYNENMEYTDEYLMTFLQKNMQSKETIFIYLDLQHYEVIDDVVTNCETKTASHHSSCFIMIPNKDSGRYELFYFNPHGNGILKEHCYNYYVTRYRTVEIELNAPLDMFFMRIFVDSLNKQLEMCYAEWTYTEYTESARHNYLGANLQCCDDKGICYVFPFVLWYHFYKERYESHQIAGRRIKSYLNLLEEGNFETMIYIIFTKYEDKLYNCFETYAKPGDITYDNLEKFREHLEGVIYRLGEKFLDQMFINAVYFICQPPIKKYVNM